MSAGPIESKLEDWRPRANPWAIAITVTLATFMEALDSSIANVAIKHIAGSLSASQDEATWVLTSYLVANAMVLPISGWLSSRLGRKRFYMTCVALFTLCSFLCGVAPTLGALVISRVLQGAAGGGLQPSEQSILADTFRREQRSMAFAIYGVAVVIAPAIGPTMGGWIIDNYSWRWIFFLNIPIGILSLGLTRRLVEDPPYLSGLRRSAKGIDHWGIGLLVVGIAALQMMLDKGQEEDWFSSRLILLCATMSIVCIVAFISHEMHAPNAVIDLRLYLQRNVAMTQIALFAVGASLYSTMVLIPLFLQEIMGYSARLAGEAVSSGAVILVLLFPVTGKLAPRVDSRRLVTAGFVLIAMGLLRMTALNANVSFGVALSWRAFVALGLPFLFIPINTLCYSGVPQEKYNELSGISALSRNLGGSVGISFMTTFLARQTQRHLTQFSAHLTSGNVAFEKLSALLLGIWKHARLAEPDALLRARAQIYALAQTQARLLAYIDFVWLMFGVTLLLAPLPLLMRLPTDTRPSRILRLGHGNDHLERSSALPE